MNNMKKIIAFVIFGTLIVSCESATYEEVSGVVSNPTFSKNIEPVINSECVSCHNSTYGQVPFLTNYNEVKNATNGFLICRIDGSCGSIMPPTSSLSQSTIDMIKLWKTQGYAN